MPLVETVVNVSRSAVCQCRCRLAKQHLSALGFITRHRVCFLLLLLLLVLFRCECVIDRYCNATTQCSASTSFCQGGTIDASIACGDAECRRLTKCEPPNSVAVRSDVCLVNFVEPLCPDVSCSTRFKGWQGSTCLRYASDLSGYCDRFFQMFSLSLSLALFTNSI